MLKISTVDGQRRRCLVVEGNLIEPWAEELITACEEARSGLEGRELIVDLRSLTAISSEGEEDLLQLMAQGLKICPHGVFARQVVRELRHRLGAAVRHQRPCPAPENLVDGCSQPGSVSSFKFRG
jgi:hypothetical protein